MISKRLESAINKQINAEFWSAYLYLSMSAHFRIKVFRDLPTGLRYNFRRNRITP